MLLKRLVLVIGLLTTEAVQWTHEAVSEAGNVELRIVTDGGKVGSVESSTVRTVVNMADILENWQQKSGIFSAQNYFALLKMPAEYSQHVLCKQVNSAVLSLVSPVLHRMSTKCPDSLTVLTIDKGGVNCLAKLILLSSGFATPIYSLDELLELVGLADNLQMDVVIGMLEDFIVDTIEIEHYPKVLALGHSSGLPRLVSKTVHLSARSFHHLVLSDDFLVLPESVVFAILSHDDLEATHEGAACDALMRWLNHSGCIATLDVLDSVRFAHVPPDYIAKRRPHWLALVAGHCNATAIAGRLKDLLLDARDGPAAAAPRARHRRRVGAWQVILLLAALAAAVWHRRRALREQERALGTTCLKQWRDKAKARAFRSWKAMRVGFGAGSRAWRLAAGPAYLAVSVGPGHVTVVAGLYVCVCATASWRRLTVTVCTLAHLASTEGHYKEYLVKLSTADCEAAEEEGPATASSETKPAGPLPEPLRSLAVAATRAAAAAVVVRMVRVGALLLEARRPVAVLAALLRFGAAEALAALLSLVLTVVVARLAPASKPAA